MNDSNPFFLPAILVCTIGLLVPIVLTIFPPPNLTPHPAAQDKQTQHSALVKEAWEKGETKIAQANKVFHELKLKTQKAAQDKIDEAGATAKTTSVE